MRPRRGTAAVLLLVLAWPVWGAASGKERTPASGAGGPSVAVGRDGGTVGALPGAAPGGRPAEGGAVPEYRFAEATHEGSLWWDGARMALSLAAVLLLVGAGAKALRRWPGLRGRGTAAGPLEVVGRVSLGAKEAVCLVRAGSQVVVVGVSPAGVSLLCRLDGTASGEASPATEAGGGSRGPVPTTAPGTRWRELAGRLRDVHAAWGGHAAGVEGRR